MYSTQSLLLSDGAIFVCKEKGLEIDDLVSKRYELGIEVIVLRAVQFNFRLQVG